MTFKSICASAICASALAPGLASGQAWTGMDGRPISRRATLLDTTPVPFSLNFSRGTDQNTWHVVMIVSIAVGIIGIVNDDSGLIVLGGAGVVLSAIEGGQMHFRYQALQGLDLVNRGPWSMGLNPYTAMGPEGFSAAHPNPYVRLSFKF